MKTTKIPWTPSENTSRAVKDICADIARYKSVMQGKDNAAIPGEIELTQKSWDDLRKTLKRCHKVAILRKMKLSPIHHITIHGYSVFVSISDQKIKEMPKELYS